MSSGAHDDDDDDLSRQKTVLANAESLSREHSARREIRLREERVRRLAQDETSRRRRPRGKGAESTPPEGSEPRREERREEKRDERREDKRDERREDKRERRDAKPERRERSRETERPAAPERERSRDRTPVPGDPDAPRLSDPFPPLQKKRPGQTGSASPAPGGARSGRADAGGLGGGPAHSGPYRQIGPAASSTDLLAMELEELLRRFRLGWRRLPAGDKITVGSALAVGAGVLMPWVSLPGRPLQVGLLMGGLLHLALAVASVALVVKGFDGSFDFSPAEVERRRNRASLYIVLLGALSTLFGAYLLVMWGAQKGPDFRVQFHFGLYWTLVCGTGLSSGGFARFGAGGPR